MTDRSSRRDFLRGKAAVDALGNLGKTRDTAPPSPNRKSLTDTGAATDADRNSEHDASLQGAAPSLARHRSTPQSYLIQIGRRAMACEFEVFLNSGGGPAETEQAIEALDLVEQLEDQLTVYRNHSEVSELNGLAARRPIRVERGLFELVAQAIELYEQTDHAFDITAGPLIQLWNRARREGFWPDRHTLESALQRVGSSHIQLDDVAQTVRFTHPGTTINLGGIGKGYALDRCVARLLDGGVHAFLMHGGSSSVVARGNRARTLGEASNGKTPELHGWSVGVRHPLREDRRLLEIQLIDASMGTSGAGTKQFYHQGKRYGHVLDPRSGLPAEGILSATAIAPAGAVADALSTAFYVLGVDATRTFCRQHKQVSALLTTAGRSGDVDVHAINCGHVAWRRIDQPSG